MGPKGKRLRVVLDTNVVVSAVVFERGRLSWIRDAWTNGTIIPLIDKPTTEELLRVLAYPKFRLNVQEIEVLLGCLLPFAETVLVSRRTAELPRCRDPHDQKFLSLAQGGKADVLVTGDQDLLVLAGQTSFAIETPAAFRGRLAGC
ncbi:MAG: putative toxin-antitoxin system toxin component, PIN family [Nitrospirae bacterium]|nr:putative toxin-antitoxin system toxin component, PIN family [Nitrospirota bacterium]MBI3393280.1 putative toxin-antitoxin system toxin component, PIN family [Nitrospirota bacterium]